MADSTINIFAEGMDAMRTMETKAGEMGSAMKDSAINKIEREVVKIGTAMRPNNILKTIGRGIEKGAKGTKKHFLGGFSIAAMVRQSQIFTSSLGAIFQVIGAMIDTLLAPLAPLIAKTISYIAKTGIGWANKVTSINLSSIKEWLEGDKPYKLVQSLLKIVSPAFTLVIALVKFVKDIVGAGGIWQAVELFVTKLWNGLLSIKDVLTKALSSMFHNILPDWLKKFLKMGESPRELIREIGPSFKGLKMGDVGFTNEEGTYIPSTRSGQVMPHGFIENPESIEDIVRNLKTGANLVKDIYSGYHVGGETPGPFSQGGIFNSKGTSGLKDAVQKIVTIVNTPSAIISEFEGVLNQSELVKVLKQTSGVGAGQQYIDDDITRTGPRPVPTLNVINGMWGFGFPH